MKKFVQFCLNYKKLVLAIYFAILIFFSAVILNRIFSGQAMIDNSVSVWFMQDDPELKEYDRFNENFGEQEWSILLLKTKYIYDPVFLRDLGKLTEDISNLSHITKVTSIANVRDNLGDEDKMNYESIYPGEDDELIKAEEIALFQKRLSTNPVFENSLFKLSDGTTTVVLIQNDNLIRSPEPYRIQMVDSIQAFVKKYSSITDSSLAGTTIVNAELNRASLKDVYVFYILISVMLTIFGWYAMRRIYDLMTMFAVVLGSILPTMGLLALLDIPYNMVTLMMPTILISISVSDIVHLISDFHLEKRNHSTTESIFGSVAAVWKPSLWTSLTTVVGFASLAASTVFPIFQLGAFICFGVTLAWITTITVAPVLLSLFYPDTAKYTSKMKNGNPYTVHLIPFMQKNKIALLSIAVIGVLPAVFLGKLEVDTDYTKFFSASTPVSQSYERIKETGFAQNPVNIAISFPEGKTYASKGYFSKLQQFEAEIKKLPEVIKLMTASDLLREINKAYMDKSATEESFVAYSPEQIGQLLLLGDMSGNDDIYDFLSYDKQHVQIVPMTNYMSSKELDIFKDKIIELKNKYLPEDLKVVMTGTTVLWGNMDQQISNTQLISIMAMLGFLLFFFPIVFKSLPLSILALIINIIPIASTYGLMAFLDIRINIATAIIGGIALGIATDDTIHMLSRFRKALQNGLGWDEAVDNAVINSGHSVVMTSIILAGGFITMFTSDFLPTSNFGILVTVSIVLAVFYDLLILPIILKEIKPKNYRKEMVVTKEMVIEKEKVEVPVITHVVS